MFLISFALENVLRIMVAFVKNITFDVSNFAREPSSPKPVPTRPGSYFSP